MKIKFLQLSMLALLIVTIGCNSSVMTLEGSKAPRYENQPVMYNALRKQKLGMTNTYTIDSLQWISYFKASYQVPELRIFDQNGNYIPFRLQASSSLAGKAIDSLCEGSYSRYVSYLTHDNQMYSLRDELNKLHSVDGQKANATMFPQADYTVFIYFNNELKSSNQKFVYAWEQKLEQQSGPCRISIVKINMTPQSWWSGVPAGKQVNIPAGQLH